MLDGKPTLLFRFAERPHCRNQGLAVRRERQREELKGVIIRMGMVARSLAVATSHSLISPGSASCFFLSAPATRRGQGLAVRRESYPCNRVRVSRKGGPLLPGGHIPKDHRTGRNIHDSTARPRRQGLAVRREGKGPGSHAPARVPASPSRSSTSQSFTVPAGRGQGLAVRRKRQGQHPARMAFQRDSFLPRGHVPQLHFAANIVRQPASGDRGQGLAVRRKRHPEEGGGMALQRVQFLAGGDIPQVHRFIRTRPGQELAVRRERHVKRVTARYFENGTFLLHWSREVGHPGRAGAAARGQQKEPGEVPST